MKANTNKGVVGIAVRAIIVTTALMNPALTNRARAMPAGPHHSFLTGPWELVVKMGLDGPGLRFPLTVIDENKPQKLDAILPVMGTPIKIRLEEYIPDLKWETTAVKHTDGGIAAKLAIKGINLEQNIWLCSGDPARQSISSSIGGVAIRKLHNPKMVEKLVRELTHPDGIGILSVWPEDSNSPFEYVAKVAETITIPNSKYKLAIAEYLPHYSVDTKTKKVFNQSEKPINPAVRVSVHDGKNATEQWLWAKFPSSPHKETKLPLRMRFADFDLRGVEGKHILIVASGTKPWLLLSKKGEKRVERVVLGRFYPFADKEYSFSIEEIMDGAIIKDEWINNSERLLHPAIIATIEQNGPVRQTVLELNKPFHYKTKYGTLVLFYRRRPPSSKGAN
jgi:hypothetical protein